jgi:hypothetical protein
MKRRFFLHIDVLAEMTMLTMLMVELMMVTAEMMMVIAEIMMA